MADFRVIFINSKGQILDKKQTSSRGVSQSLSCPPKDAVRAVVEGWREDYGNRRWEVVENHSFCPECGSERFEYIEPQGEYYCDKCGYRYCPDTAENSSDDEWMEFEMVAD